jgi:CDP-diacylglycerol--glycerol-3-phosphate 3-phosphatidyltransferase
MGYRLFRPRDPHSSFSEPNVITVFRLLASLTFFGLAIVRQDPIYNYIGFGIHWIVDFIDGYYARRWKQETVLGAEIDIIADRFEILFFYVIFLHFRPYLYLPACLYLINYAFIDFYLSNQFLKYDIIS